jgi:hypothetical protein
LRAAFPDVLAAVLLSDRARLVIVGSDVDAARVRLARLLGQLARIHRLAGRPTREIIARPIAGDVADRVCEIVVAPCRVALATPPLAWPWSTHRDVLGAIAHPRVSAERLAASLRVASAGFVARHHARVTARAGRRIALPRPAVHVASSPIPLRTIAIAAAAATRKPLAAIRQRGPTRATFVALAQAHGWTSTRKLAEVCDCTPMTIRSLAATFDEVALSSARLCLGHDDLLRLPDPASRSQPSDGAALR